MSTDSLFIIQKNNKTIFTYRSFYDGYISHNGEKILNFLKNINIKDFKFNITEVLLIDEYPEYDIDYVLTNILNIESYVNDISIMYSGLIDYGYLIDLDIFTFEIYKGFNNTVPLIENDRFFNGKQNDYGYYPMTKILYYDLYNLPSNIINDYDMIQNNIYQLTLKEQFNHKIKIIMNNIT